MRGRVTSKVRQEQGPFSLLLCELAIGLSDASRNHGALNHGRYQDKEKGLGKRATKGINYETQQDTTCSRDTSGRANIYAGGACGFGHRRWNAASTSSGSICSRSRRCRTWAGLRVGGRILELGGRTLCLGTRTLGIAASPARGMGSAVR